MDGYAVITEDLAQATPENPVTLRVTADIFAGSFPKQPLERGTCARIMTGAPLPKGATAVVPVEDTDSTWQSTPDAPLPAYVTFVGVAGEGDNIRPIGENIRTGQTVLSKGHILRPADIGVLASLGFAEAPVFTPPVVVILTSGDELLHPPTPLIEGKIYDANSFALAASVREVMGEPIILPIAKDTLEDVRQTFQDAINLSPDLIVSTAGVSVGTADYTRQVLAELGQVGFWKINFRPGKPLAFGTLANIPFFGLPGNPVSALITFDIFVRPVILAMQSKPDNAQFITATLAESITSDGRRSYLRVRLIEDNGRYLATLSGTQSSGALLSMVIADGLMIVPEGVVVVEAGDRLRVKLLRDIQTITTRKS